MAPKQKTKVTAEVYSFDTPDKRLKKSNFVEEPVNTFHSKDVNEGNILKYLKKYFKIGTLII
jgi:hypothetical protein